jgi:sulfur carrier protein
VRLSVNGEPMELPEGATVAAAVAAAGVGAAERGVAVALDAQVVPRGRWDETPIHEGARIEVLRAAAGG